MFELSADHEDFRRTVRDFAESQIGPHVRTWDSEHHFPAELIPQMGELGLFGLVVPEECGGHAGEGGEFTYLCLAIEELGRVDQSMGITLQAGVGLGINPILTYGTQEQKETWLPDLSAGRTMAGFGLTEPDAGSDAGATSLVLAEAVKKLGQVDLVLTGMASTDGTMSVVAAMLAERLGLPQVTFASELTLEGDGLTIRRDGDVATEIIASSLPAVVSVTDQINEPRYPSFKGIMAAKKKPVETWSLSDLGVDPSQVGLENAWTKVLSTAKRPPRQQGLIVSDDGNGGAVLAQFLAMQKFV